MKSEFEKAQAAKILSCYGEEPNLEKGGEGSRGGKIIGHTSSGKPVYSNTKNPAHKDFTAQDHIDAANLHGGTKAGQYHMNKEYELTHNK